MRTLRALKTYFSDLGDGDPVAWGFTALFLVFAAVIGFIAWRARADEKRWQDRRKKKDTRSKK